MLASKTFILGTIAFAFFSIYALFYSLYMTQLKFHDTSDINLLTQDNSTAWFQPKVKVVMVIIDALRFDYLLNFENIEHDPALKRNKFKKFNQAYFDNPDKFVIFRARADVPTMTVLRVPCLMTGNVPRLGSVLTAFGALPAEEDSIPRQLYLQSKKSYFTGDPILKEYFPKYLESDFKMGSFNVKDKHADEPSQKYMNESLAKNEFDFLAAHFLRLDHMGHFTGLESQPVLEAIEDIDQYLIHIMESIDDNTMLLFAGDHGMTKVGAHGGASRQEIRTAIVAYYKKGFMKYKHKNHDLKKIMRSINDTKEQVYQIDLAPTLAMLMGLKTPFSNMGQILNDLYPVGDYLTPQQNCPHAAFEMQMLHDNHLNTLQIWNYFKKYHEGQDLFTNQEYSKISNLFNEVEAAYKTAQTMIDQSHQCETSFHELTANAILKSQQFSSQVHDLVLTKTPRDLVIFWQGFAILTLVGLSYILLVQYIYKTKDYEHINWTLPTDLKTIAKTLIPIMIVLAVIWTYMLAHSDRLMRPITGSVLVLALWILGSSIVSFLSKNQDISFETVSSTASTEESQRTRVSMKSFFLFQSPLVSAGAVIIIGSLFYLTHIFLLDKFYIARERVNLPYIFVVLVGARISGRYLKITPYIMVAALLGAKIVNLTDLDFFWSHNGFNTMALGLIGDWLWGEVEFTLNKLKAGKAWSYQYVVGFTVLVCYHLVFGSSTEFVQIILPRVLWGIIIASCLASFALKMPGRFIKRNMQINLVLFLTLMQLHRKLLCFAIVLSLMRIVTFIFKRTSFKNYLYPLVLGFISYVGLFSNGFSDRKLPRNFEPAFVGIHDFHLGFCLFLYGSAMLSTLILGMLFMSFYSQDLESHEVELGKQKEESESQMVALKGHANIIKKRNILLFNFFFFLIMIGAAINPVVLTKHKKIYLSMERFLVDSVFYLFTINAVYFMT